MPGSDRSISWNSSSCSGGTPQVQPDDLGAEFGELPGDVLTDTRCTAGDDYAPAVVAPEVVDPVTVHSCPRSHSVLLTSAAGFLLSQPSPRLQFRPRPLRCLRSSRPSPATPRWRCSSRDRWADRRTRRSRRTSGAFDAGLRASAFSRIGAIRLAFSAADFSWRSMNSGSTSLPISSMDSIVSS